MIQKINVYQDKKLIDKTGVSRKDMIFINDKLKYIDKEQLSKDYIEFVGKLNEKLFSTYWWAGSISSKNQYVSPLYKNICMFIEFVKTLEKSKKNEIDVVIENYYLAKQLKKYFKPKGITFNIYGRTGQVGLSNFTKNMSGNLISLLRKLIEKSRAHRILDSKVSKKLKRKSDKYIIRTWIDSRSFDGEKYNDIFFGRLSEHIRKKYDPIILCMILSSFDENILKIKEHNSHDFVPIVPQFYFNRLSDYLKIVFLQWAVYMNLYGKLSSLNEIKFKDYDISWLIKEELLNNLLAGEFRDNLLVYMSTKNLGKDLKPKFLAVPYENHSWEKLTFEALRASSPGTKSIGYQHSSISKRIFNYFLTKGEGKSIPLPDKIITTGKISKEILESQGNFPADVLHEGCALRYEYLFDTKPKPRGSTRNILMAFPIGLDESAELLTFLVNAFKDRPEYTVKLKSHPSLPMKIVINRGNVELPSNFEIIEDGNMLELFDETDILLYSETTVCIEALMLGIPVIYIDIDSYYNKDRLFKCEHFKWTARTEADLQKAINDIYYLDLSEFNRLQKLARKYIENYFLPVTEKRLQMFLD